MKGALRIGTLALLGALAGCSRSVVVERAEGPPPAARPARSPAAHDAAPRYTVQPGDTLYKISMQYGVDYRELARWNGIDAPYTIYPKQNLRVGPASPAGARPPVVPAAGPPVAPVNAQAAAPARNSAGTTTSAAPAFRPTPGPGYDPALGVTLPEGAQPIVTASAPAAAPVFEDPQQSVPPATAPAASAAQPMPASAATATPTPPPAAAPATPPAVIAATPATPATPTATPAAATGADIAAIAPSASGWAWPTPGKVVGTYAGGDPTRQGIDIAGDAGQPVRAARDGEVVYSGAGLIGYGELVIIKHSPELLSAYGHNRVRLVKEGDKVKAGQKIAEMGKNAANRVLLHFEVRKNGKPVDPLPLLPAH